MKQFDVERIVHIQYVTNELHNEVTHLYELMCDKKDKEVIAHIKDVIARLDMLLESLHDEGNMYDTDDLTKLL